MFVRSLIRPRESAEMGDREDAGAFAGRLGMVTMESGRTDGSRFLYHGLPFLTCTYVALGCSNGDTKF